MSRIDSIASICLFSFVDIMRDEYKDAAKDINYLREDWYINQQ